MKLTTLTLLFTLLFINFLYLTALPHVKDLKNGKYEHLVLTNNNYAYFGLFIRDEKDIQISVTPFDSCDGELKIYASYQSLPNESEFQYKSDNHTIGELAKLVIPHGKPKTHLFLGITYETKVGAEESTCQAYLTALLDHYQSMTQLRNGLPHWNTFETPDDYYHFYELNLNETQEHNQNGLLGIVATGLDPKESKEHLQLYVSNTNSRPLPTNSDWQGLLVNDGAFVPVLSSDSKFKSGNYWVGVHPTSAERPLPYSIAYFYGSSAQSQQVPLLLLNKETQVGFTLVKRMIYFMVYYDAFKPTLLLNLRSKIGQGVMYVSTKTTTPSVNNYEYKGIELKLDLVEGGKVVYIGVYAESGPGVFAFDIVANRKL